MEATQRKEAEAARDQAESSAYAYGIRQAQASINVNNVAAARKQLLEVPENLRGWEWGYLFKETFKCQLSLAYTGRIAVFSPDGRRILTASDNNTAKVWDAESGKELVTLEGHEGGVMNAVFSPDGRSIVTASDDHTAKVWDAESGKELRTLAGHTEPVIDVVFSSDGRRILTASEDLTAKVWDAESGKELRTLAGHTGQVRKAVFSPDGRRILPPTTYGQVWKTARCDAWLNDVTRAECWR